MRHGARQVSTSGLGLHQSLPPNDGDGLRELVADLSRDEVEHVRLPIPVEAWAEVSSRAWVEHVIETVGSHAEPLMAVRPDPARPEMLVCAVEHLGEVLPAGSCVELQASPSLASPWSDLAAMREGLERSLERAIASARASGLRPVLGVEAVALSDTTLRALCQPGLGRDAEAIAIVDGEGDVESPHELAERVRLHAAGLRVWYVGRRGHGVDAGRRELRCWAEARSLELDRVYWARDPLSLVAGTLGRIDATAAARWSRAPSSRPRLHTRPRTLVTGGAGFVGSNLCRRLLDAGTHVVVLDALRRPGVQHNLAWLQERYGSAVTFVPADIRDRAAVREALDGVDQVFHLAAQVAVTTSLDAPRDDFEINGGGTLTLLEELRRHPDPPRLLFTSTNKVYGALSDVALCEDESRWMPVDGELATRGISERRPLDLHSPYGCSKGAADQYVLDHARSYGLQAVVFRMSCIYGPRQFGTEDQGWLAHLVLRALQGQPITIYGDGKQVRDALYVDDLTAAMLQAMDAMHRVCGRAFNLGGGPTRTLSLRELLARIERRLGARPRVERAGWRTGDQRWFVADTRAFQQATGWRPRVGLDDGLDRLGRWLESLVAPTAFVSRTVPASDALTVTAP